MLFNKKFKYTSLEERVAISTQAVNESTAKAHAAQVALADSVTAHYDLGDEISGHIYSVQSAAEKRVAALRELQENTYLHADDTTNAYL